MKTVLSFLAGFALINLSIAQTPFSRPWRYTLVEGSTITDDCPICGRPTISYPLRGTFDLFADHFDPQFAHYRMTNIDFHTDAKTSPPYTVTGAGTFRFGGAVAFLQSMSLTTTVCNASVACRDVTFTNTDSVRLTFPLIEISVTQTQFSLASVYTMHLVAAPLRELWFVVTNGFTPTNGATAIQAGDVLSQAGRIVRLRTSLLASNGVAAPPASLRVDGLDATPGDGLIFSVSYANAVALREGDLLSEHGYIVRTNRQLTAAFGIQPVVPDVGLDAVHVQPGGEVLFSIRTNIFAEGKGLLLQHGDVLSSAGQIVKRNRELLERFHPANTNIDYGLDALHVWPNGEIWFSTEMGFQDQQLGEVSDGDLLSTAGIIIFKNRELVAQFAPSGGESGFGLGDIFVVTDTSVGSPPRLSSPRITGNDVWLQWSGTNRVYLLERAPTVSGPWQALGEINPDTSSTDTDAFLLFQQSFYRLQAW